jgi:hypothetical protein
MHQRTDPTVSRETGIIDGFVCAPSAAPPLRSRREPELPRLVTLI